VHIIKLPSLIDYKIIYTEESSTFSSYFYMYIRTCTGPMHYKEFIVTIVVCVILILRKIIQTATQCFSELIWGTPQHSDVGTKGAGAGALPKICQFCK